ncbi:MAG TPA: histidine kinase [Jatrophihabitans sp.]|nr:histidine kinase [Jatrophihabitans sp.]
MFRALHSAVGPMFAPQTYLRAVFVLLGAALALALGIAAFTVLAIVIDAGAPVWGTVLLGVAVVGGPLATGLLPGVRQVEGAAAHSLLGVRFAGGTPGPAHGWRQRRRTLGWFLLHLLAGAAVVAAVLGIIALAGSWWLLPAAVATFAGVFVLGRLLAAAGPALLGPSYAERLEAIAARAAGRNRIARELHDSIGHALSLVTMQAAAARKVMDRDPDYARDALGAIETTSRRAVADLDHMLGLLRDDPRGRAATSPEPDLAGLDELLDAARSAGLQVRATRSEGLSELPVLVSREAYRIVQEGLTNALKYSADRTAGLRVVLGGDGLDIEVTNPADGRRSLRSGRGVRGIRERVTTLGGAACARIQDGRWTLSVSIPTGRARP